MILSESLKNVQILGMDTSPFIYYVEDHKIYAEKMIEIFQLVVAKQIQILTSTITITEVLVKPFQIMDEEVEAAYRRLLWQTAIVKVLPITPIIAEQAARLRAKYNLKTPDALQIATALEAKCEAFLTNDKGLKKVKELSILILDELELNES